MKDVRSAVLFLAFKRKRKWSFILTLLLLSFIFLTNAGAQESLVMPEGPAVSVDAVEVEVEEFEAVFQPSYDEPAPSPNHPPFDQIPAEDMPYPSEIDEGIDSSGPEGVCYPDPVTGETVCVEDFDFNLWTDEIVGVPGYDGADGGQGVIEESNTVGEAAPLVSMTKLATVRQDHPYRMNVKLVMRFARVGGGNTFSQCSGSMIDAETVQTAGHCVFNRSRGEGWAREIWVYPAWDGNGGQRNPPPSIINYYGYGRSTGANMGAAAGWVQNGNFDDDLGLVGIDRAAGMLTGWFHRSRGGTCDDLKAQLHNNASYPGPEPCGITGLHNGRDMYYWFMYFDDCPGNQLQLNTTGGCYDAVWGGMSGSSAYYISGSNRYIRAVASTSNRSTWANYCRLWNWWIDWTNNTFIPQVRGSSFDLQALDINGAPSTIQAGSKTTLLNHLATNPTNGSSSSSTRRYRVYLSSNDNISTADTLLSTQQYTWSFVPMQNVKVNMVQVTIPSNTPPGDYFIGVIYDSATDSNSGNNDTDGWDAQKITVSAAGLFQDVPPGYWAEEFIYKIYNAGITAGCSQNPLRYCPEDTVTRAQMAIFLLRGIHGSSFDPPTATGIFADVPVSYWAADWIEQLYQEGITAGCGQNPLRYCPESSVTRAMMAIFLLRAKHGSSYTPPPATGIFADVPVTYWAADWIEQLYQEGITAGCGQNPLRYCPESSVTRAQMAIFIVRTFGL